MAKIQQCFIKINFEFATCDANIKVENTSTCLRLLGKAKTPCCHRKRCFEFITFQERQIHYVGPLALSGGEIYIYHKHLTN